MLRGKIALSFPAIRETSASREALSQPEVKKNRLCVKLILLEVIKMYLS